MKSVSFDKAIDRRGTYCTQWDFVEDRFGEADLLPFTISDTDFAVPEAVLATLQERLKHKRSNSNVVPDKIPDED